MKITILGAGLAGISASHHLGHENCIVFEKNNYTGGHIYTEIINGFTWDQGPHVSFTKSEYVRQLFAENVEHQYEEYPVSTANYYKGSWIPHPAQSNLYAVPQPLRDACLKDFIESRQIVLKDTGIHNYADWLTASLGKTFYETFPRAYAKKYWTVDPSELTTDWVGERVFLPNVEEIQEGYLKPLDKQTHYITTVRYPKKGGYFSYANKMKEGMDVRLNKKTTFVSFKDKYILFDDMDKVSFEILISTIPLPDLIALSDAPENIKEAAKKLSCSSILIVNIEADHDTALDYNWMYVYDENKYSTRINCTEKLTFENAPTGKSGIQVEVYFSAAKPMTESADVIAEIVCAELIEMGIIKNKESITDYYTKWVPWANVIFDHNRKESLNTVLSWLSQYGLDRNDQDLKPTTDWNLNQIAKTNGTIYLAGRFAEWKYFWTDDCVLRGKQLAGLLKKQRND